jgi:hypothetical protein
MKGWHMVYRSRSWIAVMFTITITTSVAACSSASSGHQAIPSVSKAAPAQALQIWQQFTTCARQHGAPDLPDPQVNSDGKVGFGDPASKSSQQYKNEVSSASVQNSCNSILAALPASGQAVSHGPSAAQLAAMRAFAQCMRTAGINEWPDPNSDGTFPIQGTSLAQNIKSSRVESAMQSCKKYDSDQIRTS